MSKQKSTGDVGEGHNSENFSGEHLRAFIERIGRLNEEKKSLCLMHQPIRLTLPIPPSVNAMYGQAPGRKRFASKRLREWKDAAGWELQLQRPRKVTGPYSLTLYVPTKLRGDISNRIKAPEDLLVTFGVTPDDAHAANVRVVRSDQVRAGECLVVIEQASITEALS